MEDLVDVPPAFALQAGGEAEPESAPPEPEQPLQLPPAQPPAPRKSKKRGRGILGLLRGGNPPPSGELFEGQFPGTLDPDLDWRASDYAARLAYDLDRRRFSVNQIRQWFLSYQWREDPVRGWTFVGRPRELQNFVVEMSQYSHVHPDSVLMNYLGLGREHLDRPARTERPPARERQTRTGGSRRRGRGRGRGVSPIDALRALTDSFQRGRGILPRRRRNPEASPKRKLPRPKKGSLAGWKKKMPAAERRQILSCLVERDGYAPVIRKMVLIHNITKDQPTKKKLQADMKWLRKLHEECKQVLVKSAGRKKKKKRKAKVHQMPAQLRQANPELDLSGLPKDLINDPTFQANLKLFQEMHPGSPVEVVVVKKRPKGAPKIGVAYGAVPEVKYDAHRKSPKGKRIHKFGGSKDQPILVTAAGSPDYLQLINRDKGRRFKAREWIY
jgi:hypothetical protein